MFFTSKDVIAGKLFINDTKNLNHFHKDIKDFFCYNNSGRNIRGGDTVLYDVVKTSDLVSRDHVLKHLHGRIIFGPFEVFPKKVLFGEDI